LTLRVVADPSRLRPTCLFLPDFPVDAVNHDEDVEDELADAA